mmetsp:Transcript_27669/g.57922  ORF Transcript_27669/g.57922 Transcript_27669/m.57922 type:complete len:468 (-) Transcript_27669:1397-2800(-)
MIPSLATTTIVALLLPRVVLGLDCGGALTEDCNPDVRYKANSFINLAQQAEIWQKIPGLYRVEPFYFQDQATPCSDGSECTVSDEFDVFPFEGYVNITVKGTRYFQHAIYIMRGKAERNSYAVYRDFFGHSTFEKDGTAALLADLVEDPVNYPGGQDLPIDASVIQPLGPFSSTRRTRHQIAVKNHFEADSSMLTVYDSLTCPVDTRCDKFIMTHETFDEQDARSAMNTGYLTRYTNETEWVTDIQLSYNRSQIPASQQKAVPMEGNCLVGRHCYEEQDFCDNGDPGCGHEKSPYQQEDGELTKGTKASLAIFSFVILIAFIYFTQYWIRVMIERRYRTKFVERFVEDLSLGKPMKDVSPENMAIAFNAIDKGSKGYITKGELTDYMMAVTKNDKIMGRDFAKLWDNMDVNGTGDVSFVEFCMFLADCHREHALLRNKVIQDQKKRNIQQHQAHSSAHQPFDNGEQS